MSTRALITGITGQDGSYLAEFLLEKGYEVHGMVRAEPEPRLARIEHISGDLVLHPADLNDQRSLTEMVARAEPDEIYNLVGQARVSLSWTEPLLTADTTALSVVRMLEAVREVRPSARFCQASSSEMFGRATTTPQTEATALNPCTPYGAAKTYGHHMTVNYRHSYGLFAATAILFNHESPRRPLEYVTRKITHGAAAIKLGLAEKLVLGDLDAERDWGYAKEYVEAMWLILQQDQPSDFVIATDTLHSVRELVERAFARVELDPWAHVRSDPEFFRPTDAAQLRGCFDRARGELGWEPRTTFEELIDLMVDADLQSLREGAGVRT